MSIILATRGINRVFVPPSAPSGITPTVHLKLMESAGATTADDDRNVQNGTYVNSPDLGLPAMVSGGGGVGVKPGQLQYVLISHNAAFAVTGGYTWSFVFQRSKTLAADGDREGLFSKPNVGATNGFSIELIRTAGAGLVRAYTVNDAGVVRWIGNSTTGLGTHLSVGTAYRCTLVGGPAGARIYINAAELGSNDVLDGLDGNTTDAALGGFLSPTEGLQLPFNGCFGDFRFYNVALTSEQVAALPTPQNTIWLRDIANTNINEGSGQTVDLATHAHPETGITAVAGDNDAGSPAIVTHGVPSGTNITLNTIDVSVNTSASVTAQVTDGTLTSNEATIDLTVIPTIVSEGDAPQLPSLAEWLVNDEATGTTTKFVSNQNRGNGSGSSAANAQELQAALNGASAGQTFVAVCQSPGVIEFWNYPNGITFPNGANGNEITLKARNGDGVVLCRTTDFIGSRTPGSGFWTQSGLSSDDVNKSIWRSAATFSGGEEILMGWWIEFDHPHQLVRYGSLANLRNAVGTADSPTSYACPGLHKGSDGRVYIRMQKPHPAKYSVGNKWSESLWPGYPEAITSGRLDYPKTQNPNDYVIYLTKPTNTVGLKFGTGHVVIGPGINSMGYWAVVDQGATNVQLDRSTHYSWQYAVRGSTVAAPISNYFLHRVRVTDGSKMHASELEWKFGGWLEGIRSICFNQGSGQHDSLNGVYWKDCTIGGFFEVYTGSRNNNNHAQIRLRNCSIYHTFDDGFQCRYSTSRVEIGYCFFFGADWGGFGDTDSDGQDPDPGQWYVHHNIFDWRKEKNSGWNRDCHPQDTYTGHSPDGNSPKKIYNNLCLYGPDRQDRDGIGFEHCATTGSDEQANNDLTGINMTNQVFNNIIILQFIEGTKRYNNVKGGQSDHVMGHRTRWGAGMTNELTDYNIYYRQPGMTVSSKLYYSQGNSGRVGFASVAAWRASASFETSKNSGSLRGAYSPGIDGNSTDTKPNLPTLDDWPNNRLTGYRPASTAAVTVAASGSLNGANWWSTPPSWGAGRFPWNDGIFTLAPNAYKGPLNPSGSTMPVGVQNP